MRRLAFAGRCLGIFRGFRVLRLKQNPGFGLEAAEFFVLLFVVFPPLHGPIIPAAGFLLMAQLPVSHREEELVEGIAALPQRHRPLQYRDHGRGALITTYDRTIAASLLQDSKN